MARARATVFLIGLGAAWNAGNVGPVVAPIAADFDVTLGQVGLMSGSVFCAGMMVAGLAGSWLSERMSVIDGLRLCCAICFAGNVLVAVSPGFEIALVARILVGVGLGMAFLFGGVYARHEGGSKLVGVFGVGIMLGIALALAIGGLIVDLDLDWRFAFALSAVLGASALPLLPRHSEAEAPKHEPLGEVIEQAALSGRFWRLQLLATSTFTVPVVIGAWFVHYLAVEGVSLSTAGLIAFAVFAFSAAAREVSGQLLARGTPHSILAFGGLTLGAAGLAVLAVEPTVAGGLVSAALMGVGLSLPYAIIYDEGMRVLPDSAVGGLGMTQATADIFPIAVTPLLGTAIASGDGTLGWLAVAAFVLASGVANIRPAVPHEGSGEERALRAHEARGTLSR